MARRSPPDLIITDIVMPVMDGYQLLYQLRCLERFKTTPIIVSSASVSASDRQHSLAAGGDDFLPKPIYAEELFQKLALHLNIVWHYEILEQAARSALLTHPSPFSVDRSAPELTSAMLSVMPIDWLNQLYQAAIGLDHLAILQLITQVSPDDRALAHALKQKVIDFDFDQLAALAQTTANL